MFETLKKNDIVHIFGISEWMANTTHSEMKFTGDFTGEKPIFKENKKGARKLFSLRTPEKEDQLVFIGEVPFKTDGETPGIVRESGFTSSIMRGNACFNLTGDPQVIKDYVSHRNINKNFTRYDSVIHIDGEKETPLYPQVPTSSAPVQAIRANQ